MGLYGMDDETVMRILTSTPSDADRFVEVIEELQRRGWLNDGKIKLEDFTDNANACNEYMEDECPRTLTNRKAGDLRILAYDIKEDEDVDCLNKQNCPLCWNYFLRYAKKYFETGEVNFT